jgi:hypothetical protein
MTKIDGHKRHDQKIGHKQFGQATSDPTWPILFGKFVTKSNGRNLKSAQSTLVLKTWAKPKPNKISLSFLSFTVYLFSGPSLKF